MLSGNLFFHALDVVGASSLDFAFSFLFKKGKKDLLRSVSKYCDAELMRTRL
jgi:hypothetical protein